MLYHIHHGNARRVQFRNRPIRRHLVIQHSKPILVSKITNRGAHPDGANEQASAAAGDDVDELGQLAVGVVLCGA
jgi:hypothetical protein